MGLLTPLIPLKVMVFMVTMKESQIAIIMEITVYIIKIILIKKYSEYGFDNQINDSVLTDISNYSSNSNVTYNNSNGSWGDNPTSINIIFRDRYIYDPYINYYPFGYYDYYRSWYSPFLFEELDDLGL